MKTMHSFTPLNVCMVNSWGEEAVESLSERVNCMSRISKGEEIRAGCFLRNCEEVVSMAGT